MDMSLPARERGLKFRYASFKHLHVSVAPCTGAWIEIGLIRENIVLCGVAPCTGAWIEIAQKVVVYGPEGVAPCTGAWIEMEMVTIHCK